jgi:hypothetical protein
LRLCWPPGRPKWNQSSLGISEDFPISCLLLSVFMLFQPYLPLASSFITHSLNKQGPRF